MLSVAINIHSQHLWVLQAHGNSPIHQPALRIAISQDCYSAVFWAGRFEGKKISCCISTPQNDLCPDFYPEDSSPPCKDHFPRLHLTTGTILSVGSLIRSDWIHCSAILMDVLWSFLSQLPPQSPLQSSGRISSQECGAIVFWKLDKSVARTLCHFSSFKWHCISLTPSNLS